MQSLLVDYVSGVCGGIAVCLVGHPFDTTKTRLQTAPVGFYSGTIDCVRKTCPLAGQMFFRAASFSTFFSTVSLIGNYRSESTLSPSVSTLLLCGGITGFIISFIETPIDLVKTKLQVQIFRAKIHPNYKPQYLSTIQCVRHIITTKGAVGLWQGWTATAIRNTPANALFFPVNEIMKRNLADYSNQSISDLSLGNRLIAGATAGLSYWVSTYPLDVIKGRIQAQSSYTRLSWIATASDIWSEGGWRSYTKGLAPCAVRAVPACSAMFFTVDFVRSHLKP